ncbi:phospholipase/carboxylesterase [Collimonas sp. OK242]|jgi:phospholipase/carboxylesterase|uniref:alpha/beta hydrolase n=1 Tax=Collimonas sp. OK242 TaxID=1798195 RepID=UPI0008998CA1|nr:alpha/beta hydrolase-fold protein [Collimonas sp. OK242]SDY87077.1 phospholipase/carboxylesterase [Collimonas sp. OK242]
MSSTLETLEISTSETPTAAVIWMHGLGADGSDFVPIVKELDLSGCPGIRFVFPSAPAIPVTINNGYVMPAWYDILATDLTRREDEAGLRKSQIEIEALIAQQIALGITADKIVVAGFSQGCAMALQTGLRYPQKLAGLMCLSGYLPLSDKTDAERNAANQHTPIFQAHGRADPVVLVDRAEKSRDFLKQLGYQVEWHEYMMQHSVCAEEVADIGNWLRRVLA